LNLLILVNNGPKYINYFKEVGDMFKSYEHNVVYACESHWPEIKNNISLTNEKTYYFSEHRNMIGLDKLKEYEQINLRSFYYSCFDRNTHYNLNYGIDKNVDSILMRLIDYFETIIEHELIDLVLYENVSNSFAYAAYCVALKKNKKYFGLISSRIPNKFEIWEDEYGNIEKRSHEFDNTDIDSLSFKENIISYLQNLNQSKVKPDYMTKNPMSMNVNYTKYYLKKINIISKYFKYYSLYPNEIKEAYQSAHPLKTSAKFIIRNFKRRIKIHVLKKMYDKFDAQNEKFFLLPIHFQPESSTSVNAMYYDNQYEFIKNTAFSLPLGYNLFVKDHPNGIGFLKLDFYRKLKKIPNVKYIDPTENTVNLIKYSKGVITLTSTMGYEALLMEKPVITLGKVFYNYHPYCYNIQSYNEIYQTVQKVLANTHEKFKEYNIKFLAVYLNDIYEGKVLSDESNVEKIYHSIVSRLNQN